MIAQIIKMQKINQSKYIRTQRQTHKQQLTIRVVIIFILRLCDIT